MVRLLLSVLSFLAGAVLASSWWGAAVIGGEAFIIPTIATLIFVVIIISASCNYLSENWYEE